MKYFVRVDLKKLKKFMWKFSSTTGFNYFKNRVRSVSKQRGIHKNVTKCSCDGNAIFSD